MIRTDMRTGTLKKAYSHKDHYFLLMSASINLFCTYPDVAENPSYSGESLIYTGCVTFSPLKTGGIISDKKTSISTPSASSTPP